MKMWFQWMTRSDMSKAKSVRRHSPRPAPCRLISAGSPREVYVEPCLWLWFLSTCSPIVPLAAIGEATKSMIAACNGIYKVPGEPDMRVCAREWSLPHPV
eukprot:429777-Amphidinium_carterae.2